MVLGQSTIASTPHAQHQTCASTRHGLSDRMELHGSQCDRHGDGARFMQRRMVCKNGAKAAVLSSSACRLAGIPHPMILIGHLLASEKGLLSISRTGWRAGLDPCRTDPAPEEPLTLMSLDGYVLVSTIDGDPPLEDAALRAADCQVARAKTCPGISREGHAELHQFAQLFQPSHTLIVTRTNRPARSRKGRQGRCTNSRQASRQQPVDTATVADKAVTDVARAGSRPVCGANDRWKSSTLPRLGSSARDERPRSTPQRSQGSTQRRGSTPSPSQHCWAWPSAAPASSCQEHGQDPNGAGNRARDGGRQTASQRRGCWNPPPA